MRIRTKIIAAVVAVAAIVGVSLALTSGGHSGGGRVAASQISEPPVTTPASTVDKPALNMVISPVSAQQLTAQDKTAAQSAVRTLCETVAVGEGCYSSTPDSIQYVNLTVHDDPANPINNKPTYLLSWALKGQACFMGLGGPIGHTFAPSDTAKLSCSYNVAVDPATDEQFMSWTA